MAPPKVPRKPKNRKAEVAGASGSPEPVAVAEPTKGGKGTKRIRDETPAQQTEGEGEDNDMPAPQKKLKEVCPPGFSVRVEADWNEESACGHPRTK